MATEKKVLPVKKEDEKNTPAKKNGKTGNKFLRAFAKIPTRMWHAILNTIAELKKVTWPNREDLINYTTIVLIFMVLMAVVVGVLDLGATQLITLIIQ